MTSQTEQTRDRLRGLVSIGDGRPGRPEGVPHLDLSGFDRDAMPDVDDVLAILGEMTGEEASHGQT